MYLHTQLYLVKYILVHILILLNAQLLRGMYTNTFVIECEMFY